MYFMPIILYSITILNLSTRKFEHQFTESGHKDEIRNIKLRKITIKYKITYRKL